MVWVVSSLRQKSPSERMQITKLHSTKPERVLADLFTRNRIPFRFREMIGGHEVDFVIGKVIVEVDGTIHRNKQQRDIAKNQMLVELGYIPLHFTAQEIRNNAQRTFKQIMELVDANK